MARKNNRSKGPGKRQKTHHRPANPVGGSNTFVPRIPIEHMIVPKGKCFFGSRKGKLRFTKTEAEAALKQAQTSRARQGNGYVENRAYACPEGGCGDWHLTSRESWTPRPKAAS